MRHFRSIFFTLVTKNSKALTRSDACLLTGRSAAGALSDWAEYYQVITCCYFIISNKTNAVAPAVLCWLPIVRNGIFALRSVLNPPGSAGQVVRI